MQRRQPAVQRLVDHTSAWRSNFRVTKNPLNTLPGHRLLGGRASAGRTPRSAAAIPGGGNFLFVDGSVKFIKNSINLPTYCALSTRNEGEVISADAY